MTKNRTLDQQIDDAVERRLNERLKAASGTNPGIPPTGPNGLFNIPGLEPNISTTYIPPYGIEDFLESNGHVRTSMFDNPLYGIMTGQTPSTGNEPTEPCDGDVPIAGNLKMCTQTWGFGEFTMQSQVIRLDRMGELVNRSSPTDMRLINNPFDTQVANQITPMSQDELFRSAIAKSTVELANDFKRRYAELIYTGNPVNTAGSQGGYQEFNGLDRIINTGYQDVNTQARCAAADSYVYDFNYAIVQNNALTTVRTIVETFRSRKYLEDQIRIGPVQYAFVMRNQMFLALTEIWPCAYYTYRCYTAAPSSSNATAMIDPVTQQTMRDDMRSGKYLLIDGVRVPVICDNTVSESNRGNGNFSSNLYLVPLSANGFSDTQNQLTYMEYFDYRGQYGFASGIQALGPDNIYKVSGDGRFITMLKTPELWCRQIAMRTRKRIIVRTPFLAARIDNIAYNVYVQDRSWEPGTSFFVNGGNTSFNTQSFYPPVGS